MGVKFFSFILNQNGIFTFTMELKTGFHWGIHKQLCNLYNNCPVLGLILEKSLTSPLLFWEKKFHKNKTCFWVISFSVYLKVILWPIPYILVEYSSLLITKQCLSSQVCVSLLLCIPISNSSEQDSLFPFSKNFIFLQVLGYFMMAEIYC